MCLYCFLQICCYKDSEQKLETTNENEKCKSHIINDNENSATFAEIVLLWIIIRKFSARLAFTCNIPTGT